MRHSPTRMECDALHAVGQLNDSFRDRRGIAPHVDTENIVERALGAGAAAVEHEDATSVRTEARREGAVEWRQAGLDLDFRQMFDPRLRVAENMNGFARIFN